MASALIAPFDFGRDAMLPGWRNGSGLNFHSPSPPIPANCPASHSSTCQQRHPPGKLFWEAGLSAAIPNGAWRVLEVVMVSAGSRPRTAASLS